MRDRPWIIALVAVSLFIIVAASDSVSDVLLPAIPVAMLAAVWIATRKPGDDLNKVDLSIVERLWILGAWVAGMMVAVMIAPSIASALILSVIPAMAVLAYVRLRRAKRGGGQV
jgi:hypothetical protein